MKDCNAASARVRQLVSSARGRKAIVLSLVCLAVIVRHSVADQMKTCAPPSSNRTYEWEQDNYYQVLDLPGPPSTASRKKRRKGRSAISPSDIRKAYRKQAQLYHPDKVAKNQTITVEERTARFARIAEAYEVLNDDQKRQEYDEFLLDCEDHLSGQDNEETSSGWVSVFEDLSTDPRRVFEEFFFGSSSSSEPTWEENVRYDDSRQSRDGRSTPIRVYETREVHHDPHTGSEILRILQTEEFLTNAVGKLYFRVMGQDFVEQYDPVYGFNYVPITQPFLVDEGYTYDSSHHHASSNTLSPGEFLRPESTLLKSSSGRYYAGLSTDCELLIMTDAWEEDTVLWSSGTYVPASHVYRAGGCFLGLRGPHLVLALGSPDRPGTILWYSDVSESVVEEEERIRAMGAPVSLYVARLDDDGSLAVYRHETVPRGHDTLETKWWFKILLGQSGSPLPRTHAARAWANVQTWIRKKVERHQKPSVFPREVCIYATGPAGCNAPGRKIFHIAHGVGHSVKHTMTKIDNAIDTFVESITEDEDEDFLDTIFRVANKASSGLLRAGRSFFRIQARLFHTLFRTMRERFDSARQTYTTQ